jgi:replicative DNA helicase
MSRPPRESPKALDAERALLGGLIDSPEGLADVLAVVPPEAMAAAPHRMLLSLLRSMAQEQAPIDLVTVAERVRPTEGAYGGLGYVLDLPSHCPAAEAVPHYARLVAAAAQGRRLLELGEAIAERAGTEAPGELAAWAGQQLAALTGGQAGGWRDIGGILKGVMADVSATRQGKGPRVIPTGYPELDRRMGGGMRAGQMGVIAARPGMGKTAFALCVALNAVKTGLGAVGIFSMEMEAGELGARVAAIEARVSGADLLRGRLQHSELVRVQRIADGMNGLDLYIDDAGGLRMSELESRVRALKLRCPDLALIVVDYIGLMKTEGASRQDGIADISGRLKALAKSVGVPVVALSQLNRKVEERDVKRPMLSDLRDSGAIEQDADWVVMLYREAYYYPDKPGQTDEAEVILAKCRGGSVGTVLADWDGPTTTYRPRADPEGGDPMDAGGSLIDQVGRPEGKVREFKPRGR